MTDLCQCPRCGRMHRDLQAGEPPEAVRQDDRVLALDAVAWLEIEAKMWRAGEKGWRSPALFCIRAAEQREAWASAIRRLADG